MVETGKTRIIGEKRVRVSLCPFVMSHGVGGWLNSKVTSFMCNFKVGFFFRNLSGGGEKTNQRCQAKYMVFSRPNQSQTLV